MKICKVCRGKRTKIRKPHWRPHPLDVPLRIFKVPPSAAGFHVAEFIGAWRAAKSWMAMIAGGAGEGADRPGRKAVRTTFLLDWTMNDSMRRAVHNCTTKIERHHKLAKHLAFGEHGRFRSNNPSDHEKAIVYNELVANAVALQNVVDQTQALHALKSEGIQFSNADLAFLSPYGTGNLKRFDNFPTDLVPDPLPVERSLPA